VLAGPFSTSCYIVTYRLNHKFEIVVKIKHYSIISVTNLKQKW